MSDYVGKIFSHLVILHEVAKDKYSHRRFLCKCSCGNTKIMLKYNLDNGRSKSCGCLRKTLVSTRTKIDLVGKTFGRLCVVEDVGRSARREVIWKCLCSCGNIHFVTSVYLLNGDVRSCGCLFKSMVGKNNPNWRGSVSYKDYCFLWRDMKYKLSIRERDNSICQNPYCYKNDTLLHIHHIDYDKKNCHPSNLITVCRACNARANYDRAWHTGWYQTIMHKRYNY